MRRGSRCSVRLRRARQRCQMPQQRAGDSLTLEFVDDRESELGRSRADHDITPPACDDLPFALAQHGDEGDLIDEVDVDECCDFLLAERTSDTEEAPVERLIAGMVGRREQRGAIAGSERANIDPPSVAQQLSRRKRGDPAHRADNDSEPLESRPARGTTLKGHGWSCGRVPLQPPR